MLLAVSSWLHSLVTPTHATEWISGLTGAGGAVLGSLVTVGYTAWYSHRTRLRERREKFAAGSFATFQRLNQIYSVAIKLRDHLREGQMLAEDKDQPVCTVTMGIQRMSGPVSFTIDELWTLTQVSDNTLINRVNSLDHAFNALLDAMDRYASMRDEVWKLLPAPDKIDGIVGSVGLTQAQAQHILPEFAKLDHFLSQLLDISSNVVLDTYDALKLLVFAKAKPLGKNFKVEVPNPQGEVTTISTRDRPKDHRGLWRAFCVKR